MGSNFGPGSHNGRAVRSRWPTPLIMAVTSASAVAALDAITGRRVVFVGGLVIAPVLATVSCRAKQVLMASLWAVGLGLVLGVVDGIWGTYEHAAFLGAVVVVSVASTVVTAVVEQWLTSRSALGRGGGWR
jgi:hypothetical protein